jgi:hypothetical protein
MLRYTDLIPVVDEKTVPGTENIAHLLSGGFDCSFDPSQEGLVFISTKSPGTAGSVRSILNGPGKPGWTLVFTTNTRGLASFVSCDCVLDWFDDARAAIHEIFDRIVPGEIVQSFR